MGSLPIGVEFMPLLSDHPKKHHHCHHHDCLLHPCFSSHFPEGQLALSIVTLAIVVKIVVKENGGEVGPYIFTSRYFQLVDFSLL